MRKINRILGALQGKPIDALAADLIALDELLLALGRRSPEVLAATPAECAQAAGILSTLDTPGALDFIIHWRAPVSPQSDIPTSQE